MGIFNNTSYTMGNGKTMPARMKLNSVTPSDTTLTITPDRGTTHRVKLAGPNSQVETFKGDLGYQPETDYKDYWITAARESYKNKGNQPSPWNQFKAKIGFKQQGGQVQQTNQQGTEQEQIIALVKAAMQGDQKATQTVNQIMEAAKAGDQKAIQYAQMIQQVVEAMKQQQQTPVKRYGSKLNYIKSLKYAKGGKTCPTCQVAEKGAEIEMKKCGGKKAKKRYFGGYL